MKHVQASVRRLPPESRHVVVVEVRVPIVIAKKTTIFLMTGVQSRS
jgi:hypothetical protein